MIGIPRWARLALLGSAASAAIAGCSSATTDALPFVGQTASVTAINIAFDPVELALPAGGPLRILLDNQDSGVPHNVKVFLGDREIAKSPIVTGPATTEVRFGPLPPASYQFICEVHPNMLGTIVVTP
jgi:plastocyanin